MAEKREELLDQLLTQDSLRDLRLSYSRISAFAGDGPGALTHRKELSGDGISLGKVTDLLLFEPDKFKEEFFVFDGEKPTAQSGTLADIILLNYTEFPSEDTLFNLVKLNNLWSNIKNPDLIQAKWEEDNFKNYIEGMFRRNGRTLITNFMYQQAIVMVGILKSHKHTKHIFRDPLEHENFIDQCVIEFRYKNFMIKGVIDRLVIDHQKKTIKMIDLKTGANHGLAFMKSFMDYRYYLQAAIYSLGVNYIREQFGLSKEYTLLPFEFVYIGATDQIPYVYTMTPIWEKAAVDGFTTRGGYKYKGLNELLEEIEWHLDNQLFDLPKEIYEKNGLLTLKDDFIIANE